MRMVVYLVSLAEQRQGEVANSFAGFLRDIDFVRQAAVPKRFENTFFQFLVSKNGRRQLYV